MNFKIEKLCFFLSLAMYSYEANMDKLKEVLEGSGLKGWLAARARRAGSEAWIDVFNTPIKNILTKTGLAQVALLLNAGTGWDYAAIGQGTNAASNTNTALQSEVDRQQVTFSRETTTHANDTGKWVTTHQAPGGGWAITEFCLVNATPSGGVIYNRVVFASIPLAENDELEMTYRSQAQAIT